jgi:SWI/SNF-related matrix-associated actin-dependent regulator 1 of chromatin subfamily A
MDAWDAWDDAVDAERAARAVADASEALRRRMRAESSTTTTTTTTTATTATTAPTTIEFALREPGDAFAIARATPRAGALGEAAAAAARDAGATRASDGAWTAPASAVRAIRDALVRRTNARVLDVPGMALRCAEVRFEEDAAGAYARGVPKALDAKMFEFQRTGVMYALRRRGRVLIGDEMGLGKTVQACALLACYREECPALILVPTSLREAWRNALQSWLDVADGDVACVGAASEGWKLDEGRPFDIVPYSLVVKLRSKLLAKRYKIVVCDESHFLKDRRAQRTQAVMPLLKDANRAICLTGTPALSRPIELFTQLEALVPKVFARLNEYGARYCANGGPFGMYTGCTHADELHVMISKLCMVRRLKKDVLKDLPPKQRTQVWLALEKSSMGDVRRIKSLLDELRQRGGNELEEKRLLNELFLASAKAKTKSVCEYLETLIDGSTSKFLFFAHHGVLLDAVAQCMDAKKVKTIRIDGSTPAAVRGDLVNAFQRRDDVRVAILSIKAAGMGLTLTAASTVIFGEMVWTPGDLIQAEDRAHRIGQQSSVLVQYLHAKDTIDEIIWQSIKKKLDNLGAVLNGQTSGNHLETTSTNGKSPKRQKVQPVIDVSQRTLTELFASQATQLSSPAGEDSQPTDA